MAVLVYVTMTSGGKGLDMLRKWLLGDIESRLAKLEAAAQTK